MFNAIEEWAKKSVRASRDAYPMRMMARASERYLNAWYNTGNWDFDRNGEAFLLQQIADRYRGEPLEVWDVGAHEGEYAECVHAMMPAARVTSFEIVPEVAARLRARNFDQSWFEVKELGLSDRQGLVSVTCEARAGTISSINPRLGSEWFDSDSIRKVDCQVTTVDTLIKDGLPPPNFLKIDVEGHEAAIFDGSADLLTSPSAPNVIQFEYGDTWIPESRTLHDVQRKLEGYGYRVGRLYPKRVEFKPYAFSDERFRMGNMVAVRDAILIGMLS